MMAYDRTSHSTGTYADKRGAERAAKRELGKDAREGWDFELVPMTAGRYWYELGPKYDQKQQ